MNKAQFVEKISDKSDFTKADVEKLLDAALEVIRQAVKKGDEVKLVGFGTFTKTKRKARKGHNPQTGEEIKIQAAWVPKFRAGTDFRNDLRK